MCVDEVEAEEEEEEKLCPFQQESFWTMLDSKLSSGIRLRNRELRLSSKEVDITNKVLHE